MLAGSALAASLFANAAFVPQQEAVIEANLQSDLNAIVFGEAEALPDGSGYSVSEVFLQPLPESLSVLPAKEVETPIEAAPQDVASVVAKVDQISAYTGEEKVVAQQNVNQVTATGGTSAGDESVTTANTPVGISHIVGFLARYVASPLTPAQTTEVLTTFVEAAVAAGTAGVAGGGAGSGGVFGSSVTVSVAQAQIAVNTAGSVGQTSSGGSANSGSGANNTTSPTAP